MSATQEEVVVDTPLTLADRFSSLLNLVDEQTKTHTSFMKTVNSELKALQKELSKAQPKSRKKKKEPVDGEDVVKRKNVFDVPVPVSDELCEFLGVEKVSLLQIVLLNMLRTTTFRTLRISVTFYLTLQMLVVSLVPF
jgi:hypothetical protein